MAPNNTFDLAALAEAGRALEVAQPHQNSRLDEEYIESQANFVNDSSQGEVKETETRFSMEGEEEAEIGKSRVAFDWDCHVDLESDTKEEAKPDQRDEVDRTFSSPQTRRFIRHKSSLLLREDNVREVEVDEERLSRAVCDAGLYAHGIIGVEVWELDQDDGLLRIPRGGRWRHPYLNESDDLERLENEAHPQYTPASPCMPGVGLAGNLWFESTGVRKLRKQSSVGRSLTNLGSFVRVQDAVASGTTKDRQEHQMDNIIRWRDLKSLLVDPDTAKEERLGLMYNAGFCLAAGVPFETGGSKGIVVFLARDHANQAHLLTTENQAYMVRSSDVIGSIIASVDARRASLVYKKSVSSAAFRKARRSLVSSIDMAAKQGATSSESPFVEEEADRQLGRQTLSKARQVQNEAKRRLLLWLKKCRGGDLQAPPAMTFRQAAWTWIGCFVGLLILSAMNEYAQKLSENEFLLLIGPFGALMTLQYGLTAAPASQPRNVILGQAIAGAVSMSFTYIPESMLSTWMRRAVGPAFSIATMLKLGIPHPPAGAHSVIYASGQYGWMFYFLVVFASIISVIPATVVNNMSEKRQYPTYWFKKHNLVFPRPSKDTLKD